MIAFRLQYYYRNRYMSEWEIATHHFYALSQKAAIQKAIRKMKKKAGNKGAFKSKSLHAKP